MKAYGYYVSNTKIYMWVAHEMLSNMCTFCTCLVPLTSMHIKNSFFKITIIPAFKLSTTQIFAVTEHTCTLSGQCSQLIKRNGPTLQNSQHLHVHTAVWTTEFFRKSI